MDLDLIKTGLACKCPRCKTGDLYKSRFDLTLLDQCQNCNLDFTKNDSADGPAVFLTFILGSLIVPIALIADRLLTWPLWLHGLIWGVCTLILIILTLKPLKAYIIALQFKHRPNDWE
ncbi:MAG: DUF983 domain-containing protein [Bdellovibrionales bacterium]